MRTLFFQVTGALGDAVMACKSASVRPACVGIRRQGSCMCWNPSIYGPDLCCDQGLCPGCGDMTARRSLKLSGIAFWRRNRQSLPLNDLVQRRADIGKHILDRLDAGG